MRYLFKRLDQQTTTTAHPQWAMGTHRSAPCPHLDGLVTDMDALFFYEFPLEKRKEKIFFLWVLGIGQGGLVGECSFAPALAG